MNFEPLRIAIVGGGSVGEHFLRDFGSVPAYEIVGIITRSTARQRELAEKYCVPAFGTLGEVPNKA